MVPQEFEAKDLWYTDPTSKTHLLLEWLTSSLLGFCENFQFVNNDIG